MDKLTVEETNEIFKIAIKIVEETDHVKFDMEEFRSERTYRRHTQPLETCVFEEDDNDESDNALLQKFIDVLSYNAEIDDCMGTRYWWIDLIEDFKIVGIIKTLPKIDIELITLIVFEGYSQTDAASILQITDRAVRAHWSKIKDLFVNVL